MADLEILEILSPGILTSVQDLGRYGYGRYGVAPSGALDSFALRIANLLVGNRSDQACLEIMLLGPAIKALEDVVVAVTGGNLQPRRDKQPLAMWRSQNLKKGDILSFSSPLSGFRAYVAVGGGISVPRVMGSRSTNFSSGFGGFQGRALKKNDILTSENHSQCVKTDTRIFSAAWIPVYPDNWSLRVIWGPQDDHFPADSRACFLDATYIMSADSDRTGIRLQGPVIRQKPDIQASIISEGVISGSVQIPGDGMPIIILGETVTGGYRKIATVISADLPLLGQIKPGDSMRFTAVSLDEARQALIAVEENVRRFEESLS
ncbi:MAG: biotin-dependent carboxyltransferase family protein [Desulfobacterales bacterium]